MNPPVSSRDCRAPNRPRRTDGGNERACLKAVSAASEIQAIGLFPDVPSDCKDQLLCELELQRTVAAEEIRSLEKIRKDLERAQESYNAFYTQSPVGYFTLTQRGHVVNANASAAALFGIESARLNHLPFKLLVHRQDVRSFLAHLTECKESHRQKAVVEFRLRALAAEPIPVQLISVAVGEGAERSFLTAIVDISERIRSEHELAEAKEFLESIVETVSQPLAVLDAQLRVVRVNRAFSDLFNHPAEYARDRIFEGMLNLWWSGNALRAELEKVLVRNQPLENFQVTTELRDGSKRVLLLNARRLCRKQGSNPLILAAIEDITIRKQAEEQLQRLNQDLEARVGARTEALRKSNEQMEALC